MKTTKLENAGFFFLSVRWACALRDYKLKVDLFYGGFWLLFLDREGFLVRFSFWRWRRLVLLLLFSVVFTI
jgi:hypothetical protein